MDGWRSHCKKKRKGKGKGMKKTMNDLVFFYGFLTHSEEILIISKYIGTYQVKKAAIAPKKENYLP